MHLIPQGRLETRVITVQRRRRESPYAYRMRVYSGEIKTLSAHFVLRLGLKAFELAGGIYAEGGVCADFQRRLYGARSVSGGGIRGG